MDFTLDALSVFLILLLITVDGSIVDDDDEYDDDDEDDDDDDGVTVDDESCSVPSICMMIFSIMKSTSRAARDTSCSSHAPCNAP